MLQTQLCPPGAPGLTGHPEPPPLAAGSRILKRCKGGGWISFPPVPPPTYLGHATSSTSPSHTKPSSWQVSAAHGANFICCLIFFLDFSGIFWVKQRPSLSPGGGLSQLCCFCVTFVTEELLELCAPRTLGDGLDNSRLSQ